jgi:uncharacterized damage-inducible protein DinB
MKKYIDFICAYTNWASELMWKTLHQLTDEQWQEPQAYSVGSVRDQVLHMMYVSMRWLSMLQQSDDRLEYKAEDFPTVQSAEERWHELWVEFYQYVVTLDDEDLLENIAWGPTRREFEGVTPRWQLLSHLINHNMDHRSQIFMTLNTKFGVKTPEQDMIFYIMQEEKRVLVK